MERFYRTNPEQSRASSVYSTESTKRHTAYSEYAESMTSTSSRPLSFTPPSYMNTVPPRKPVGKRQPAEPKEVYTAAAPIELPTARSPPSAPLPVAKGLLVIAIAASPHPSTKSYVEMMLKRGTYSGVVMIGNVEQEIELKQLKMSMYALLGKLSLEIGVQMELQTDWTEENISSAISKAVQEGELISGVLCSPSYDGNRPSDGGILSADQSQLQWPWKYSVGFLHSVAKCTLSKMRTSRDLRRANASSFLVTEPTETTAVSHLYETACENIVTQLQETGGIPGLAIAYAQDVLIPEPEPLDTNGKESLSSQAGPVDPDIGEFSPGESPTRLWGMWALQDELDAV